MASEKSLPGLSPRERQVLVLVARGHTTARIGLELGISPHTVRVYLDGLIRKLRATSRMQAVTFAIRDGVLDQKEIHGPG